MKMIGLAWERMHTHSILLKSFIMFRQQKSYLSNTGYTHVGSYIIDSMLPCLSVSFTLCWRESRCKMYRNVNGFWVKWIMLVLLFISSSHMHASVLKKSFTSWSDMSFRNWVVIFLVPSNYVNFPPLYGVYLVNNINHSLTRKKKV
jgi:hypothetical protein